MNNHSQEEYYIRNKEVERINKHAYDKRDSAMRRDRWLYEKINENNDFPDLTEEQIREVEEFWKPYEYAYKNDWHQQQMYTAVSGRFDPAYFSFGMQRHLLAPFWSDGSFKYIGDKNFTPLFFPEVKMPTTFIYNISGVDFNTERQPVSSTQAIDILLERVNGSKYGAVIKPSGGGEGKDIQFIDKGITKPELEKIVRQYGRNYICQEAIKNHASFAAPYSGSLNTLRICTLFWDDKVHLVGAVLRMGTSGRVDNWSQGGLAIGIEDDGSFMDYAFTELGKIVKIHPTTGFVFKGHKLYRFNECVQLAIKLHGHIAQQKFASWDITVDEDGEINLIEVNSPGSHELVQMTGKNGYVNKEITKQIFDKYLIEAFFFDKATFDWNYREFRDHVSLREYKGFDSYIKVPAAIGGKPVRILYRNAILQKDIERIDIPDSVHYYGKSSFPNVSESCVVKVLTADE